MMSIGSRSANFRSAGCLGDDRAVVPGRRCLGWWGRLLPLPPFAYEPAVSIQPSLPISAIRTEPSRTFWPWRLRLWLSRVRAVSKARRLSSEAARCGDHSLRSPGVIGGLGDLAWYAARASPCEAVDCLSVTPSSSHRDYRLVGARRRSWAGRASWLSKGMRSMDDRPRSLSWVRSSFDFSTIT